MINNFLKFSKFNKNSSEIKNFLTKYKIKKYTTNPDGSIDVHEPVLIMNFGGKICPVKFNIIEGNFTFINSDIESTENLPTIILGSLNLLGNKIHSLSSKIEQVSQNINISFNPITYLANLPDECVNFTAVNCNLKSLWGAPKIVRGNFEVNRNSLTSLQYSPEFVGGIYNCSDNNLKNLDGVTPNCTVNSARNPLVSTQFPPTQTTIPLHPATSEYYPNESPDPPVHINSKFQIGDFIRIITTSSKFYNCKGHITEVYKKDYQIMYKAKFDFWDNPGLIFKLSNDYFGKDSVTVAKISDWDIVKIENTPVTPSYPTTTTTTVKKMGEFSIGDKVVYISNIEGLNKDFHLYIGNVKLVNSYNKLTYDVFFSKQMNLKFDRTLFMVEPKNIKAKEKTFELDDRVVYNNTTNISDEFNGRDGIIINSENDSYDILFNDGEKKEHLTNIKSDMIVKYIKPLGSETKLNDTIIFIKPNSDYYGCKGIVTNYNPTKSNPYTIEITTNDGNNIEIETVDANLETSPEERGLRPGDRIRYITDDEYFGSMGKILDIIKTDKLIKYSCRLKTPSDKYVNLILDPNDIILLEESDDFFKLQKNQLVQYINPNSKYNGQIANYVGDRFINGYKQLIIEFEYDNRPKTLYVDDGTLVPYNDTKSEINKSVKTNIHKTKNPVVYTTSYTKPKKKKITTEETHKPSEPILVFNRRPVTRLEGKKKKS